MDAVQACALLESAGFRVAPEEVRVEAREGRWAVTLPGDRMAWFPMGDEGRWRLTTERRVLRLLAERCSFRAPRVLHEAEVGWDVRALVPGAYDPWGLYRRIRTNRGLARRLGRAIGGVLAEQHARVQHEDVAGWLPETLAWPEPLAVVRRDLPAVVDDPALLAAIERALRRYEDQEAAVAAGDRVLVHGDLGFHNVAVDPATDELAGVFDYDGAAWADRHHDFRYLVFDHPDDAGVLDGALEVYEPATGTRIDRGRVWLCNAAGAIGFLAFRRGVPPEAVSCGRTLEEDLRWTRAALAGIGIDPARP